MPKSIVIRGFRYKILFHTEFEGKKYCHVMQRRLFCGIIPIGKWKLYENYPYEQCLKLLKDKRDWKPKEYKYTQMDINLDNK